MAPAPTRVDDADPEAAKAAELEESRMPFLSHLRELRDRVRNAALYFLAAFGVCFWFSKDIYNWLRQPLFDIWATKSKDLGPPSMAFSKLTEPFWVQMSVAMWAGIFVASPFIFFQI